MTRFLCIDVCPYYNVIDLIYNDQLIVILVEAWLKIPKVYEIMAIIPSTIALFINLSYTFSKSAYTLLKVLYPNRFTF